jgi:hypothetical protein
MILSVIRIGLGFVSARFLFLQGMLAADLSESQTKRAVIAVGLVLMSVVVGMVLRGPGKRGMSYGTIQANDGTSEVIRRE